MLSSHMTKLFPLCLSLVSWPRSLKDSALNPELRYQNFWLSFVILFLMWWMSISEDRICKVNLARSDLLSNEFLLSDSSQTYYLNNETRVLITVRSLKNFTLIKTWELFKRKSIYTAIVSPGSISNTQISI